ncbi:MAG: O-acetyl-ADP-ribose deacetylase [Planctomycetes bacterium]|nr:O-acetyl-ADP-ribose deacetylase [Planctomycetota bacterium]
MAQNNIILVQSDITQQDTDAIVNAANSSLMGGGGVDGAIHKAGGPKILQECKEIVARQGRCPTGQAVITSGGNLKAKYVIHTVGPIWRGGDQNEPKLLQDAYCQSLTIGTQHADLKTIAFPSISTGAYRFPIQQAATIALTTVNNFVSQNHHYQQVRFVLFSPEDLEQYQKALATL